MQFRAPPPPQVRDRRPVQRPASSDRDCPLDTARDRCLWHAGGTPIENDGARTWPLRLQLYCWARPILGDPASWASREGGAAAGSPLLVMSHLSTIPLGAHPSRT